MKWLMFFGACLAILWPVVLKADELYVSSERYDAEDGSRRAPLAPLNGARETVREWKECNPDRDITVWFDSGLYTFSETEVFGLADSGTAGLKVTYRARPLSGLPVKGACRKAGAL